MSFQWQRYQKTPDACVRPLAGFSRMAFGVTLIAGLFGCAGAETPSQASSSQSVSGPVAGESSAARVGGAADSAGLTARQAATADAASGTPIQVASLAPVPLPSVPAVQNVPPQARQAVIDAREAVRARNWARLAELVPVAQQDPVLGTWAEYWQLHQQLTNPAIPVPDDAMREFFRTHSASYLADRLKGDWLVASTRSGNYALATSLWPLANPDAQETCAYYLARHMTGFKVRGTDAIEAFKPVGVCWDMLDQFVDRHVVRWQEWQWLFRAELETSKAGNARRLAAIMFSAPEMNQYTAIMKDPKRWLQGQDKPKTLSETELVTLALSRLAYGNEREQNAQWIQAHWASRIPKPNLEWVWSQFGLVAALNVEPNAVQWYRQSGNARLTDYNHAWQVRSELRQQPIDWNQVANAIRRMSARQAAEPVWMYWYARALEAQGNKTAAKKHYESIASGFDFYGQLALEELGQTIKAPAVPSPVTPDELQQARMNSGLQRAVALFDLGWRQEAVPEWNYALRGMTDRQLRAAAEFAREQHIYDRVINTSQLTKSEIDFSQRFIAPFEGRVSEKAREINLDPAWVYGLIRQESRFITDARSKVGASGLMQLMPATARWVARKIGMKDFTPASVNDFDTNTILGTRYLSMVLNDLNGSEVLATAGYNAGPGRPVQWRSRLLGPVEGAVFAETIPFTETRLYVKHVLSNATYYAAMFTGQPQSLKQRLGTIAPAARRKVDLP